jgi:hypothetical protein
MNSVRRLARRVTRCAPGATRTRGPPQRSEGLAKEGDQLGISAKQPCRNTAHLLSPRLQCTTLRVAVIEVQSTAVSRTRAHRPQSRRQNELQRPVEVDHAEQRLVDPAETNSNFGFNLPWWDRLFGTYRAQPAAGHQAMTIGIEQFREPRELRLDRMLLQPLRAEAGTYPLGRRPGAR